MSGTERDGTPVLRIADLVATTVSSERSLEVGPQLVDTRQRLLTIIRELVARDDVENLSVLRDGVRAGHLMLRDIASAQTRVRAPGGEPYRKGEPAPVHALRALAALSLALTGEAEETENNLRVFRQWSERCGLALPGPPLSVLPADLDTKHTSALRRMAAAGDLDLLSLTWLASLDGWLTGWTRPGPAVGVLFDLGPVGRRATLRLSTLPRTLGLPGGLVPDPATMALSSADNRFRTSLAAAWEVAAPRSSHTVLWSLTDQEGPVARVTGESLSLAFAVLLDEQRRLGRPVWGPVTVRRLRPRTAVVGRIDPNQPEQASSVSGYDTKLSVVGDSMRVVLPHIDRDDAVAANRGNGAGAQLCPVTTWRQAARTARSVDRRRLLVIATVLLLALTTTGFGLYQYSESQRDSERARLAAADLAARAATMQNVDPTLSAKLALTAHHLDPENSRAVDALREVLENNRNVVRTWRADPSRVDTLAMSEQANRVLTSGSEGVTKVWTLSPTVLLGELPRYSRLLEAAQKQSTAAAAVEGGVVLYDLKPSKPVDLGFLPKPACTGDRNVAALRFVDDDSTLVVVWKDGAVSTYDVATRSPLTCLPWPDVLAPLHMTGDVPTEKVVAADVIDTDNYSTTANEVMLLLSTNDVVSVKLDGQGARIEVPRQSLNGDASLVAASPEVVAVAMVQGVAVWSRTTGALLANPAGGFGFRPRVLREFQGNLILSGDSGTAVVQVGPSYQNVLPGLTALRGGAATVASASGRNVVAGGPGGRISVLADSSGELALPQASTATAMAFLPDGSLVAADTPEFDEVSIDLTSSGLVLVDPRAHWFPDAEETVWRYDADPTPMYITDVAAAPDLVAAGGQFHGRGSVLVWPWNNHTKPTLLLLGGPDESTLPADQRTVAEVRLTPDSSVVVARHQAGRVGLWSTRGWKPLGTIDLPSGATDMAVFADKAVFVAGSGPKTELVEADTATARVTQRIPVPRVGFVAATADGSHVLTVTTDGVVQPYDRNLRKVGDSWRIAPSADAIADVSMDRAGARLAIAQGHRVLIYDLDSRTLAMPPLDATGSTVIATAWSPNGQLLGGTVRPAVNGGQVVNRPRVWKVGEMDWTSQICRWAGGGLTPQEWRRYVTGDFPFTDLCVSES
jgi:hypothetical protein